MTSDTIYTAISFAPVQGFIEKSRKLRDLYGASLILSYLSQKIVQELGQRGKVISPALPNVQEGMPNRILVKAEKTIDRDEVKQLLLKHWKHLLTVCREWVEKYVPTDYLWAQKDNQISKEKGEWERWGEYSWEVFWGYGNDPHTAMEDLETRKLKRDWVAINWVGESSSLSGTDAIAWPQLGRQYEIQGECQPGRSLTDKEQLDLELFYRQLSWLLDEPKQRKGKVPSMSLESLRAYEKSNPDGIGRYIAVNERLSIPELVKRLVTYEKIDADRPVNEKLDIAKLKKRPDDPEFKDIYREAGYWTGWFMGDGDKVGDKLQQLANRNLDDPTQRDRDLQRFSELIRGWGQNFEDFQNRENVFPDGKGRVIYAGGDDFMGVLYSEENQTQKKPEKLKPIEAWGWLLNLPKQWEKLQNDLEELGFKDKSRFTYSVGFVWAGHQVPQRDVLQHCREAEKRSKSWGRDRVTIRVLFNNGQYVQWTCPWSYLDILTKYRDRNHQDRSGSPEDQNWTNIYNDWAKLKARHSIRLNDRSGQVDDRIALEVFKIYFNDMERFEEHTQEIF
ncbi:MAG: type III-B CRISPR-associated protein Cas10/Cmr2, partial [Prochlorotrichaceae cyanobacterium]